MTEVWKAIPDWEGCYEASDAARIRSVLRFSGGRWQAGIILRLTPNNRGYLRVDLHKDGRRQRGVHVAHLVALTFLGPRPENLFVCHNNDDKHDNRVVNLRYGTRADNIADATVHGAWKSVSGPRLDIDETEVLRLRTEGRNRGQIARLLGVGERTVGRILAGTRLKASQPARGGIDGSS